MTGDWVAVDRGHHAWKSIPSSAFVGVRPHVSVQVRPHDVVSAAVRAARDQGVPLRGVLLGDADVIACLGPDQLDELLDPAGHAGEAGQLVDAALASITRSAAAQADPRSDP